MSSPTTALGVLRNNTRLLLRSSISSSATRRTGPHLHLGRQTKSVSAAEPRPSPEPYGQKQINSLGKTPLSARNRRHRQRAAQRFKRTRKSGRSGRSGGSGG